VTHATLPSTRLSPAMTYRIDPDQTTPPLNHSPSSTHAHDWVRPQITYTLQGQNSEDDGMPMTGFQRFPLSNFKYCLTLFSKFFSSFPHGTCSLSVSRQYLALDETYHPFRAAIPNNSTRRTCVVRGELQVIYGILTLSDALFQKTWTWVTR
jgi:hypothetical protein